MERHSLNLIGDVDDHMVAKTIDYFNEHDPIDGKYYVYLCTPGGEVDSGFAIYDVFQNVIAQGDIIEVICAGKCYSIGTLISSGGSTVSSLPNTQFLIHYGTEVNSTEDEKKQNDRMNKLYIDILDNKLLVNVRTLRSWMKKEKYFNPREALKAGLIDNIIGVK